MEYVKFCQRLHCEALSIDRCYLPFGFMYYDWSLTLFCMFDSYLSFTADLVPAENLPLQYCLKLSSKNR
jgi:hypothetical protein